MSENNVYRFKSPIRIPILITCVCLWPFLAFFAWIVYHSKNEGLFWFVSGIFLLIHFLAFEVVMTIATIYFFGITFIVDANNIKELHFRKTKKTLSKEDVYATIVYRPKSIRGGPLTTLYILPKKERGSNEPLYSYDYEKLSVNSSFFKYARKDKRILIISSPCKQVFEFITKTFTPVFRCYDNSTSIIGKDRYY